MATPEQTVSGIKLSSQELAEIVIVSQCILITEPANETRALYVKNDFLSGTEFKTGAWTSAKVQSVQDYCLARQDSWC